MLAIDILFAINKNHGAGQRMRRMKAELINTVRQQRAGAKLNSTISTSRRAELNSVALQRMRRLKTKLNNIVRQQRAGAELNSTIPAGGRAERNNVE